MTIFYKNFSIKRILCFLYILVFVVSIYFPDSVEASQTKIATDQQISKAIKKVNINNIRKTISYLQSHENRSLWEKQWKTAEWVARQFENSGLEVVIQNYEFNNRTWPNIIAKLKGNKNFEEITMLIAHIDSTSDSLKKIAPGADDNATGVAVILEVARILKDVPMDRTVIFTIFTNEERGASGSKNFARKAKEERMNIQAVINLDILGYNPKSEMFSLRAMQAHQTLKHKLKAFYGMSKNLFLGINMSGEAVKVAGRVPNRKLVEITSNVMRQSSGLEVKELVRNDCG
jgi:acetylornithine deacetylase/succinyl-diaminopimelate desuccinylase-like protein